MGRIALLTGDYGQARELHERARLLVVEQGFKPTEIDAGDGIALTARKAGRLACAQRHLERVLDWYHEVDIEPGSTLILAELGFVAEQRGDASAAGELHLAGL